VIYSNRSYQHDFQDRARTPTLLLTWANAGAAFLGSTIAQAVHATVFASFIGFFSSRGRRVNDEVDNNENDESQNGP